MSKNASGALPQSGEEIRFLVGESSLGKVLIAQSNKGIVSILIGEDRQELIHELQKRFPRSHIVPEPSDKENLLAKVIAFVEKPEENLYLPLDVRGTAFQKRVWNALKDIPLGETTTYTEVARRIGASKAIRAVGNACSTNNLALAIPCHRVTRKDGSLSGGYHWGSERQRALLDRESVNAKGYRSTNEAFGAALL